MNRLFLVFFFLFLSGPLYSGDLKGVKLACNNSIEELSYYAFSIKERNIITKWHTNWEGKVHGPSEWLLREYPKKIHIYNSSHTAEYIVDRKTLKFFSYYKYNELHIGYCELTSKDPEKVIKAWLERDIKKQKKGNKF